MSSRSSSTYSDDHLSNFSTTSSQWTTTYRKLPKKQPMSIKVLSWMAGAPRGATQVKKKVRDAAPDDRSTRSGSSAFSYWAGADTQLYWVTSAEDRYYYGGGSGGCA
ncbi:hypothetical protein G7046_g2611 [Stylonectria norvegica]|nr:hypothetical protein G7046_g2611 [Stylonectria norvegica]